MASSCPRGVQTKKGHPRWSGAQKLGELSYVDLSYAAPRHLHTLALTGRKWVAFANPVPTGWLVDVKVLAPYVVTGQQQDSKGDEWRYPAVFLRS